MWFKIISFLAFYIFDSIKCTSVYFHMQFNKQNAVEVKTNDIIMYI